jgi:hypothetical protein
MVSVNIRSLLLQLQVPDRPARPRVEREPDLHRLLNEIGQFESGVAARVFGTAPSVVIGGVVTLGVVAATAALLPALRRLRRIEPVLP